MGSAHGSFDELPAEAPFEGVTRRSFDSAGATVTSYVFEPHARFPLHRHPEEQITVVLEGDVECTADGELTRLAPGDWAVFTPYVEHGMAAGPEGARFLVVVLPRRSSQVMVLDAAGGPVLPIVEGEGTAQAIVWPGMGARHRSLHRITLAEGARTVELRHPMEAVYYVLGGSGSVLDAGDGSRQELVEGSMVHVEPETPYRFEAGAEAVELVGGPCPPDPALYAEAEG